MSLKSAALTAFTVALLVSCTRPRETQIAEGDRKNARDFVLKDSTGQTVKLSDYKGKVVLLNFWATWCGPCKQEIPWFIDFEKNYKDKDFAVLGVSMDDDGWDSVKPYIEKRKINYRVVVANEEVSKTYGDVAALPTTFIIDRSGRVAYRHVGLVSKSNYQDEILNLLNAKSPATTALLR